ncbi:TAXI family TRAP transporter solute-binding subunit [Sneathiella chungangensis]|uniref:TAXI family TRAP transporter solute-binding subunit n=1 Tax=Sneathiella chungangensis TaxID=1418234 RepID=A0A845MH92_9PROT|nr:TAXI family TRAP transporter solute-binding subunit [Sneathiella chungangensis]MZR23199.1 TAXI family TRAP transporter solute-binding subunit [Sneathiella chungangensis]
MKRLIAFAIGIALSCATAGAVQAETYSMGTNQQGSLFYSMGAAISKVMVEKTGEQYRVAPYAGSSTYIPLINTGKLAFGFANGGEAAFAYEGIGSFEGHANTNLRLVGVAIATQTSFAVPTNSPFKTVSDLKGARLPSGYNSGRTFHYYSNAALATGGLTIEDAKKVPMPNFVSAINAMADGKVDAALIPMNAGVGKKAMATMKDGWRYISLVDSPEARAAVSKNLPSARIASMEPDKSKTGVVDSPTYMIEVDFYVLTGADVSDDVVYQLTKTMYENKKSLAEAFGAFNRFQPDKMVQENPVPYHPGAVKFYKEVGQIK